MNPEKLLEISNNTSTVAFHKFVLLLRGRSNDLFCFYEGKDCQYYSLRIKQLVKKHYHPISCGNKNTVLQTFELFQKSDNYKKIQKAFFVDSDFDVKINTAELYETPCYSVENFYANKSTLIETLRNEFDLTEEDEQFKTVLDIYDHEQLEFNNVTLLFNGWYAALKKKKSRLGLKTTNANLDEKLPKGFICIKIGSITSNYDLKRIKDTFPEAIEVTEEEVNISVNELSKSDLTFSLRGKYQLWFFYTFLKYIIEDANSTKNILKKKTKFNVDKSLMISHLSQYAITPECLVKYLLQFN